MSRLAVGDVVAIPLADGDFAAAQVVDRHLKAAWYFAVYATSFSASQASAPCTLTGGDIALLALSFDAKVRVGDWRVLGRCAVRPDVPWPAYKVVTDTRGSTLIVDHAEQRSRPARRGEADRIHYRDYVAPVRIEKAIRALHGLEAWHESYDSLKLGDHALESDVFSTDA